MAFSRKRIVVEMLESRIDRQASCKSLRKGNSWIATHVGATH